MTRYSVLALLFLASFSLISLAQEEFELISKQIQKFNQIYENRVEKIKPGSRPFVLDQGRLAKTVVLLHGLSDSPGSMKEIATVYYENGYNVLAPLLRDHGLKIPYRDKARSEITLEKWREDIDQVISIATALSDNSMIALAGYSMGGSLALDTAFRYRQNIASIVLLAPMFKMMFYALTPMTKFLSRLIYSTKKGIAETPFFYPDIALNQTFHASELARHLDKVSKTYGHLLQEIPKLMFLTDADTTIKNRFAYKMANRIGLSNNDVTLYENSSEDQVVLHRDLPVTHINANNKMNPFLQDIKNSLHEFLMSL